MLSRSNSTFPWKATTSWHSCRSSRNVGLKLEAIAKALHERFLNGNPRRRQVGRRPSIKSWEGRSLRKTGIACKHRLLSRSIGHWLLCESQVARTFNPWEFLSFRDLPRRPQCIDNESATPVSSRTSVKEWLKAGQAFANSKARNSASNGVMMIRLSLVVFALAVFLTQLGCAAHTGAIAGAVDGLAQLNISPTSLSFGTVQSGSYVTRSEQLENTGHLPIFVFSTAVHGAAFDFNCPNLPLELKPQSKLLCNVGFRPHAPAKYAGKIIVWFKWRAEDASDNGELQNDQPSAGSLPRRERWKWEERDVTIAAVAASSGELRVSSSAINFGDVTVGSTQKQVETLYAAGGPVTVSSATVDNAEFAMGGISLPVTIPAGRTASLIMAFRPESPGAATGALTLDSSAINSSAQVPITGTGTGTPGGEHSVTLSWDPSTSEDVVGYNIYRGTQSGGPYSLVNSSPGSNTTATDDHVSAGQTYYYVVATLNSDGLESAYSNQASAVIPSP